MSLWEKTGFSESPEIKTGNSILNGTRTTSTRELLEDKMKGPVDTVDAAEQTLKTFQFEPQQGFVFEKIITTSLCDELAPPSMLSHVLGPTKRIDIETTFHVPDHPYTVLLKVPETCTFAFFLKLLLRDYNTNCPTNKVDEVLEAYVVDFPTLKEFNLVKKYSHLAFIVKEDPKYAKGPQKDKIVLRVSLPTGIYKTMAFQPNQKMHAVLTAVCEKSKLDPTEHLLYEDTVMVSRDMTVNSLARTQLRLVERSRVQPTVEAEEPNDIFWYGKLARKYKRYHVLYAKKGLKSKVEEVVLGIDGEHIAITVKKGSKKLDSIRHPITEVVKCELQQGSTARFYIEVQTPLTKVIYNYEAPTNDIARVFAVYGITYFAGEIVGKLKYLIKMQV